jgi:DNA-binding beta-propeller fold protein YncE
MSSLSSLRRLAGNWLAARFRRLGPARRRIGSAVRATGVSWLVAIGISSVALFVLLGGAECFSREVRDLPGVAAVLGVGTPSYSSSVLGLHTPLSVAATDDGQAIYVAEGTGERFVRRVDLDGVEPDVEFAPPQTTPATRKPVAVAVGQDGLIYAVDRLRLAVDVYAPDGRWLGLLSPPVAGGPWEPLSVDTDRDGNIYVTNTAQWTPTLVVYAPDGTIAETYETIEAGGVAVSFPTGIGVSRDGRLFIGDSNNSRLVELERGATSGRAYSAVPGEGSMALPRGVAFDGHGFCLVVDANDHAVWAWDVSSTPPRKLFQFGEPGIDEGAFLFPNDISVDGGGALYVADRDNDRVQIWRY